MWCCGEFESDCLTAVGRIQSVLLWVEFELLCGECVSELLWVEFVLLWGEFVLNLIAVPLFVVLCRKRRSFGATWWTGG